MNTQFFHEQGTLALASRLKVLSERMYAAADHVYQAQGSAIQARWFPILRLLSLRGPMNVGDLANEIGLTHSAVSQLATRLVREGWLRGDGDASDRRRRVLSLTPMAEAELKALQPSWEAIRTAVDDCMAACGADLLAAVSAFERGLAQQSLHERMLARLRENARRDLRVVPFEPSLREHFYRLNAEWLGRYFYIEPIDREVLSNPEEAILATGGAVFFALVGEEVAGTCALLQESPGVYELTKMAVTERRQGLGIGRRLLEAAIAEFRRRGGRQLFLESSSRLQPALRLYESMGFEMQPNIRPGSHYQRADVYMIWRDPEAGRAA